MNTPIPSRGASGVLWVAVAFVFGLVAGVAGDRLLVPVAPTEPVVTVAKTPVEPAAEKVRKPRRERRIERVREEAQPVEAEVAAGDATVAEAPVRSPRGGRFGAFRLPSPEQINAFKTMWTLGQDQTYAKLTETFGLEEDGMARLKDVVAEMNVHLAETVDAFAALLREQEGIEASPELQVRALGEFATILSSTYDSIGAMLPADRRNDVQKIELVRLISPNAFDPVVDVMRERMGDK